MKTKILLILACVASVLFYTFEPAKAVTTDPSVTVSADATSVAVGTPITFTACPSVALTPSGRITFRTRGGSNLNVANDTAFVHGRDLAGCYTFGYTPSAGEVGRVEVFTATIYVPASGHLVKPYTDSVAFEVVAAPPLAPVAQSNLRGTIGTISMEVLYTCGPGCGTAYGARGYGYPGTAFSSFQIVVYCSGSPNTPHYGPRVYVSNYYSTYICPSGQTVVGVTAAKYV